MDQSGNAGRHLGTILSCTKKTFIVVKAIRSAKIYITAHGLYEGMLNGRRIGQDFFTPGFTSYDNRLQYQTYDVGHLLKKGQNLVLITLAGGWYGGTFGSRMGNNNYGKDISLLCRLKIRYRDGSSKNFVSDDSWMGGHGPILSSGIYQGETVDTRLSFDNWSKVKVMDFTNNNLISTYVEPVKRQEKFLPRRIFKTPSGEQIVDFGQNIAGWVRITIKGRRGDTITLRHAEMLDKAGNFYTGNLREAKATDIYVLNGINQVLEPHFTYHGFRYAQIKGFTPTRKNCMAIAVHTNLKRSGSFRCSDTLINRLQQNINWSLNSNFFDIPTDCPQRSERLGWTGDAQVFCHTACYNRYTKNFYLKWLADLAADQGSNGGLPNIIPDVYRHTNKAQKSGVAGWGDASTIVPWTLYEFYGDRQILRDCYKQMKGWVNYIQSVSKGNLWLAKGYGDWYVPGDSTSIPYINQCFYAHSLQLLVNTAQALDETKDSEAYGLLLQKVKGAFLKTYILKDRVKATDTQTAYVLALQFDMLPDSLKRKAATRLAALIRQNQDHLATGFLGTPYLLSVLSRNGYLDIAYKLLNQRSCPSWLYPVRMGATTIWEKWDAVRPDSNLQAVSFNHYAYGAVGDWLYSTVAGINEGTPGFEKIIIQPHPGGGLRWAKATYRCKYGWIMSGWKIKGGQIRYHIIIPPNTTAIIELPGRAVKKVSAGNYLFFNNAG